MRQGTLANCENFSPGKLALILIIARRFCLDLDMIGADSQF